MNVNEDEGERLAEPYRVGTTYPVFILVNSEGEVITRWTGYTGGPPTFISRLKNALKDLTSINQRVKAYETNPTLRQALTLARYFADTKDNLGAVEYYLRAREFSDSTAYDYSQEIFLNTANAVWQDDLPFEEVLPVADAVLGARRKNAAHITKVAQIMARLARKLNQTDRIKRYLQAGINITANAREEKTRLTNIDFKADYALHVNGDTTGALEIKTSGMPTDWRDQRDQFYAYSKWCLERKINMDEAERLARRTIDMVYPGVYRARVLSTVAEICLARGKQAEAIEMAQKAIAEDPDNRAYTRQLERYENRDQEP